MWRRYYRKRNYSKKYYLIDGISGIVGLYILYLVFLWFTDKANFWRWLSYGIITIFLFFGVFWGIDKIKNRKNRGNYFQNIGYSNGILNHQSTPEAKKLGNLLENLGQRVEFEKWDGHKHIDIAITDAKTNIEVDGSQHNLNPAQAFRDRMRDFYSSRKGFKTIRIPNSLLKDDVRAEETARLLDKQLQERVAQLRK